MISLQEAIDILFKVKPALKTEKINFSDSFANNPQISTEYAGIYTVSFTDNACDVTLTANIEFLPNIYTQVLDTNICIGSSFELNPLILNTAIDTLHNEWTLQPGYIPTINWFWEKPD